ncbi:MULTISPECIES: hypothetical protein [unclassified Pseudomonas]|uniref:hypothetical protein n=1 Tax=unclassified Pseudomonas TaxID=196821 RepID=UPI00244CDD93|nr:MULTISPECIES: hypothetical protein [unclassified Pseudomonas]MDH0303662.1 hypothetical protein [Pseudomonas sp. GD04091]MDH1986720.1 hypothetical protein [Pseudomonas sp. GD03689]
MDNYDTSALGLQKCLLNMRRDHARLEAQGELEKAASLARVIATLEEGLNRTPEPLKPTTLQ